MSDLIPSAPAPVVTLSHGHAVTTSKAVADYFGKRHDNVMQDIRNLIAELPPEHLLNFQEASYEVEQTNGGTVRYPAFEITRDGFTLLAMGFTGKKALQFKLAYIDAFNKLEALLHGPPLEAPAAPVKASIRSRDDLSFTRRDELGRLINWSVPHDPRAYWGEGVARGQAFFGEVAELAATNEHEAYDALRFALSGPEFQHGPGTEFRGGWGMEDGFVEAIARAAIVGLRALRNGADPFDPDGKASGRKAKALAAPKRRALPAPAQMRVGATVH